MSSFFISRWNEALGDADTIVELLKKIPYLDRNFMPIERIQDVFEHDPCYDDEPNRFDGDLTVDIEGDGDDEFCIIKPSEERIEQFKQGKVKLYALHICVHIQKVVDLSADDVIAEGWRR